MGGIISLVAAMTHTGVIGKGGSLPWHIPRDLARFRELTLGKPIIMGRKTFESLPGRRPLPGRHNIVVSRRRWQWLPGQEPEFDVVNSLFTALAMTRRVPEVMVIGGGEIFEKAMPYADRMYLTMVAEDIQGDTYFPEINYNEWKQTEGAWQPVAENCRYGLFFETLERKR